MPANHTPHDTKSTATDAIADQLIADLNQAKSDVLAETNAQTVLENLEKLHAHFGTHRKRWIWELLQNAADAAVGTNNVEVTLESDAITFAHNGATFTTEEVTHLIYHGSTKQEDDTKKGKFGSGFLTVHLLSPSVTVRGVVAKDGITSPFGFSLNRKATTAKALKADMDSAWKGFTDSLRSGPQEVASFATSFRCPLDGQSREVVEAGLNDLEKNAPFVVGLVEEIARITVRRNSSVTMWTRGTDSRTGTVLIREVLQTKDGSITPHRLVIAGEHKVDVAVGTLLRERDGGWFVTELGETPRLFYPLPLVGTHDLGLPFAVFADRFEPEESRDGIYATATTESTHAGTRRNWELLDKVPALFRVLANEAVQQKWGDLHLLADFAQSAEKQWLDGAEWVDRVLRPSVSALREPHAPRLLATEDAALICVASSRIPAGDDSQATYELTNDLQSWRTSLPQRNASQHWSKCASNWAVILKQAVDALPEVVSLDKIALHLAACGSTDGISAELSDAYKENPCHWLNIFFSVFPPARLPPLLRGQALLPDQLGKLRKEPDLKADMGIDGELKDICHFFGLHVRSELLHERISDPVRAMYSSPTRQMRETDCLDRALKAAREGAKQPSQAYDATNVKLLRWLLARKNCAQLAGFTVACKSGYRELTKTSVLLAPAGSWLDATGAYAEIFPAERILSDSYATLRPDDWQILESECLIQRTIFCKKAVVEFDDSTDVLLDEQKQHKPTAPAHVRDILCLDGEEGICSTVRNSKTKGRLLFRLLVEYILRQDDSWLTPFCAPCVCGDSHPINPRWMQTLRSIKWVSIGRKSELPTAQSIAQLLTPEMRNALVDDPQAARFLLKCGIGITDVLRCSLDEAEKFKLDRLSARIYGTHDDATLHSIEAVLSDSDIRDAVLAKQKEKARVHRNQSVGQRVETLLRSALETEGIRVTRTGVGSDFEVETDFIENDMLQLLSVGSWLIEVKATTEEFVRMTLRQGEEAVKAENRERYAVCVVPLVDDEPSEKFIYDNCRFVAPVALKIAGVVSEASAFKSLEHQLPQNSDVRLDVFGSTVRLRLNSSVWRPAITLSQFVGLIKQQLSVR
jgi:hypothetical protein